MTTRVEMFSPPRRPMDKDTKLALIVIGGVLTLALIIAGGLLLSQWMDLQEVKNIHVYLPGAG